MPTEKAQNQMPSFLPKRTDRPTAFRRTIASGTDFFNARARPFTVAIVAAMLLLAPMLLPLNMTMGVTWNLHAALAQNASNPSGLPLPRFVSLRDKPINVRVGPGTRYDVSWVFVQAELPVEIIQEFDTWRKVRDLDGQEGWIHQNLLIGRRTAYIAPWSPDAKVALRTAADTTSSVRAWLGSKLLVSVENCDGLVCRVATKPSAGQSTFSGFVDQEQLWGVYAGEVFD